MPKSSNLGALIPPVTTPLLPRANPRVSAGRLPSSRQDSKLTHENRKLSTRKIYIHQKWSSKLIQMPNRGSTKNRKPNLKQALTIITKRNIYNLFVQIHEAKSKVLI